MTACHDRSIDNEWFNIDHWVMYSSEDLVPTDPYDPGIVEYDGDCYTVFGVWNFYMARLNENMISLAEKPKK